MSDNAKAKKKLRKKIRNMDKQILGPALYCEICAKKKVLSPCFSCQYSSYTSKEYCRGCGQYDCKISLEICQEIAIAELCFEIIIN